MNFNLDLMFVKTFVDSNDAFENACMEFDEVNLKPTYKILWGIPGLLSWMHDLHLFTISGSCLMFINILFPILPLITYVGLT